jgi:DNA ligase-1
MLAHAIEERDLEKPTRPISLPSGNGTASALQAVGDGGVRRLYSRTGDDVAAAFPDLIAAIDFDGVIDGELLVGSPAATGSFSDLQQRLNRKTVSAKLAARYPAFMRCYDLLQDGGEDLRALPFTERRARLEAFVATLDPARFDLSPLVAFDVWSNWTASAPIRRIR